MACWAAGRLGGILTAHTGFPLTIKMSGDPSGHGRAQLPGERDRHAERSAPRSALACCSLIPTPYAAPCRPYLR